MKALIFVFLSLNVFAEPTVRVIESQVQEELRKINSDKRIYKPMSGRKTYQNKNFLQDRSSGEVIRAKMNEEDVFSLKMCHEAGVLFSLDEKIEGEIESPIVNNEKVFSKPILMGANRVLYIAMLSPITSGSVETFLYIPIKGSDSTYIFRILGVPCATSGGSLNKFPKKIIVEDKTGEIYENSRILSPEDKVIETTKGYDRKNVYEIIPYNLVADANSDWSVLSFGIVVNGRKDTLDYTIQFLDSFLLNDIPSNVEYLKIPSEKASRMLRRQVARFSARIKVDKKYIIEKRNINLFFMDNSLGIYQQLIIDLKPFLDSLRKKGYSI